jgi:hypothetical protein
MKVEDEMLKLPTLNHVGLALVEFVYSLEKGTFVLKTTDWIYHPNHFVAFGFPEKETGTSQIAIQTILPTIPRQKRRTASTALRRKI